MSDRAQYLDVSQSDSVELRSPPNWTAVAFFGALGLLHLSIATSALVQGRWEAHMSVVFGGLFGGIAVLSLFLRHHIEIAPAARRIRLRSGLGRFSFRREVPFSKVLSVRVIVAQRHRDSCVCIVCTDRDIEIPTSPTPRQQALALALALGVRLIKVYAESVDPEPGDRIARLQSNASENE